jgi:hypothetical protein
VLYGRRLTYEYKRGDITALEALEKLVNWRAQHGSDDRFVNDISICVLGDEGARAVWSVWLHQNLYTPTFLWSDGKFLKADSGFRTYYQDDSSQTRHFWMYVNAAYVTGNGSFVDKGNEFHEGDTGSARRFNNGGGTSLDMVLGYRGRELGLQLRAGTVDFNEAGNWIHRNLGPVGPGSR